MTSFVKETVQRHSVRIRSEKGKYLNVYVCVFGVGIEAP